MVADGRARHLNAWPFVAVTLVAGSFGILGYLIVRELRASRTLGAGVTRGEGARA
jgi:hypothetical protein